MSFALLASKHLIRRAAVSSFVSANACRTLVCTPNNKAKLGTAPQPVTSGFLPSHHWTIERVVALSMLPMYPIAIIYEPYLMDYVVSAAVSLHAYWGFGGVIRDYAIERKYGPLVPKVLQLLWKAICLFGFAGFTYFNYYDIGVIKGVKKIWSL
ncbi:succinate dehydrogenase [Echinococcus multilocularis]|uniref:Succinate dehydrogenase [ubiquinone] cytochrome b small subunit n=1 Tax=Echinococcus multilocularis TaxID=6211 RepID=A0A068YKN0_ECHMU|nr:cytochrome b small subunit of complex II [Echinococcus multilocularis]CDS42720.1 succinate dehydrogenase [Echinococcus multilocularis]